MYFKMKHLFKNLPLENKYAHLTCDFIQFDSKNSTKQWKY